MSCEEYDYHYERDELDFKIYYTLWGEQDAIFGMSVKFFEEHLKIEFWGKCLAKGWDLLRQLLMRGGKMSYYMDARIALAEYIPKNDNIIQI